MQRVTKELQELGVNECEKINASQLILLGLQENEIEEWQTLSLNKQLSDARAELFVLLKGIGEKEIQEKIIVNYKALQKFRQTKQPLDEVNKKENLYQEKKSADVDIELDVEGNVTLYCDGGCTPNPGKAGSGVALYRNDKLDALWYGLYESMGTNNTAELGALYQSLLLAQKESQNGNKVQIKCDSMYSINCIQKWAISWEKKGWTKKGGEIKNLEIIKKAYALYNTIKKDVDLSHIKAHAGFEGNELADRMTMYAVEEKSEDFIQYSQPINIEEILSMKAE
ncbi:ribonuclease H [Sulfurimonas sp. SAG-AH-194-I05]|nr:ribonuclease H family protein [Sulfurimonas sp. SAG-AH-194-I05]MDF1876097.1 ribonuclease H [Sulfurimonas sp. SAG-AH-194-I05]